MVLLRIYFIMFCNSMLCVWTIPNCCWNSISLLKRLRSRVSKPNEFFANLVLWKTRNVKENLLWINRPLIIQRL